MPAAHDEAAKRTAGPARALHLLYGSLGSFVGCLLLGTAWDVYWHSQNLFETFLTPPHLLMYAGVASAGAFAVAATYRPELGRWFGAPIPLRFPPASVPGSVLLVGSGALLALSGAVLDDGWHAAYGLDETRWSLPHAMVAWAVLLTLLGFLSCRMSLAAHLPITRAGSAAFGGALMMYSFVVFLGPMFLSSTPEAVAKGATLPGFQGPDAQHYFRIVAQWELYRTNALYPALVGLWAGSFIAMARGFEPRPVAFVGMLAVGTAVLSAAGVALALYVGVLGSPGVWLPPMLLPSVVLLLWVESKGGPEWLGLAGCGAALGGLTFASYGGSAAGMLASLLAVPALFLGHRLGRLALRAVAHPGLRNVQALVLAMGLTVPALLALVDVYLRTSTP
ncbi:MAG TPA: hypothetical protein VGB42_06400 [Candidatus Thermoplasmatota archaeon]